MGSPAPVSQPLAGKPIHKSKPPNKPGNEVSAVRTTVRQFNIPNGYQTRDSRPNYGQNQVRYYDGPGNRHQVNFESDGRRPNGPRPRTTPPGERPGYTERPRRQKGNCWTCGAPDHHSQYCPKATQTSQAFGDRKDSSGRGRKNENSADIHYHQDGTTGRFNPSELGPEETCARSPCLECSSEHERAVKTCFLSTHSRNGRWNSSWW